MPNLNSINQATSKLGICRATLYKFIQNGQLRTLKIGRRRLVSDKALDDFIRKLERDSQAA